MGHSPFQKSSKTIERKATKLINQCNGRFIGIGSIWMEFVQRILTAYSDFREPGNYWRIDISLPDFPGSSPDYMWYGDLIVENASFVFNKNYLVMEHGCTACEFLEVGFFWGPTSEGDLRIGHEWRRVESETEAMLLAVIECCKALEAWGYTPELLKEALIE